ncbi:Conserved hypothetical, protein [Geosmithia morbida]|uniref:Conserved hypothetical, protein n=1 Tax=Geosmithia morbida TaxID=1094350 RepID=A0A9P4YXI8_9HYPO|nr:Conserved hypothetical, protein [Geosmithia morbida]KAF4124911.1 Conserved hypothetical, protein [Geosmithia morbida]
MLFRSTLVSVVTLFVAVGQAQYKIDPDSVDSDVRDAWCVTQKDTCPLICQQTKPGTTLVNTCDSATLTYGCLCGDNKKPNLSEYSLTLPYFVCREWGTQCVANCGEHNNECASDCRQNHPCGAQSPTRVNVTSTSAAATASATDDTTIYDRPGTSSSDDDEGAAATLALGRTYGTAVVLGGMFVGFAILL